MRCATIIRFLFALTLLAGLGLGCAKRETAEVTQQRTEMTQDHQTWNTDLQTWDATDAQIRAVLTAPPPAGTRPDTTGMSDRLARLQAHEQAVLVFRQQLADLDTKLANEQEADHAALWAEHQRLRAEYDRLKSEHDQLVAQMGGVPGTTTPGGADTTAARY